MEPLTCDPSGRLNQLLDVALRLSLVAVAFLLGCQELFDADVWWHVRAGQWICASRQVPTLDPFTFASADRPWIDLHWLFQLILAASFALAGVRGMILLASSVCALVLLVVLIPADRRSPSWLMTACWLPALVVMSARFDPRPEILSLLGVAAYLAVLLRTDDRPVLAWVLPPVQVLWVNVHALFVLGPIIFGLYLADRTARSWGRSAPVDQPDRSRDGQKWRIHMGGAALCVGAACLVNPYGIRGALFPLELFPKITAWGNVYKSYVSEFMDMREMVQKLGLRSAAGNLYFRAECFLLLVLPLSFIVPAIWRAARTSRDRRATWLGVLGLTVSAVLVCVLGFPGQGTPVWMVAMGRLVPLWLVAMGLLGVVFLVRSSRQAAVLAILSGLAEATWIVWLRAFLLGPEPGPLAWLSASRLSALGWTTILLGVAVAGLTVRSGAHWFRMLLAVAFGYLALQAVRNINLFGLVAGYVIASNLGPWVVELTDGLPEKRRFLWSWSVAGLAARGAAVGLVGLLMYTIISGQFFRASGELRRFGPREFPLAYAHDAARFAGRPGLPDRALVLDLRQAGVYLFHNGPERKLFIDGRLEVPSRATFETFVRLSSLLREGRRGWAEAVRRMGDPLILLDHEEDFDAEATLLADPEWRCLYYDAIASVFVSSRQRELEASFPTVDFAERHFSNASWQAVPSVPWGLGEARALIKLTATVRRRPEFSWPRRLALMLAASDRLRQAIDSKASHGAAAASLWTMLGNCVWNMTPDLTVPPLGPDESWDSARGMLLAQASFCYRQALALAPEDVGALMSLHDAMKARRMRDAQQAVVSRMRHGRTAAGDTTTDQRVDSDKGPIPAPPDLDNLPGVIARLLEQGRPLQAVQLFLEAEGRGVVAPWPVRDQVAAILLHLGYPADARRFWERGTDCPSRALRLARLATASLAECDFPTAQDGYLAALEIDPTLADAWLALALLNVERGQATPALTAAREGLRRPITPVQKAFLTGLEELVARHASIP